MDDLDELRRAPRWLDAACARRNMGGRGGRRGGCGGRRAWTPNSDPDTVLWLDAALSPRSESTSVIDQLNDLSSSPTHATATGTQRPAYDATILGGAYPGIVWDGIDDRMYVSLGSKLVGATGITICLVAKDATTAARYVLEYGANGGTSLAGSFALLANIGNANSLSFYVCGNAGSNFWRSNASTEDLITHKIIVCRADFTAAGASEVDPIRVNGAPLAGAQTGTANNTGAFSSQTLCIGAQNSGSSPDNIALGALCIVKRRCSDADVAKFEEYFA